MRTANFRDGVLLPMAEELNVDTYTVDFGKDFARNFVAKVNARIRTFLDAWRWPEWNLLEQMAFRPRWRDDIQWLRTNANGKPDEFYYITNETYYRVKNTAVIDPPPGTVPTNPTYFTAITLGVGDRYLALEETCRRTIGEMIAVFNSDPRVNPDTALGIPFMPSERGIEVWAGGQTVWAYFKLPIPQFTSEAYTADREYQPGETRLYINPGAAGDGECFRARKLVPFFYEPTLTDYWARIPFPDFAVQYVVNGATGDAAEDTQAAIPLWAAAKAAYQSEVDKRIAQGQTTSYYSLGRSCLTRRIGGLGNFAPSGLTLWLQTLTAGSGTSAPLTNTCVSEFGDTMAIPPITGNTTLIGTPFDIPATEGQSYLDVDFAPMFGGNLLAGWEVLDGHFEYVGALDEIEVPIPPTLIRNADESGFRAVTSQVFGVDAADYHYVGRITGTVA